MTGGEAVIPQVAGRKASIVWRLTVRLSGVMPIVWRTILIRPDVKLSMLHRYLQAAMGWDESHLFSFIIGGRHYGIPNRDISARIYDARRYTVARLFPNPPASFEYIYDFGAYWTHRIDIEGPEEAQYRRQYPICIDGGEPCPPEDCGGPHGYAELRTVLRTPNHPEHAEMKTWADSQHYPRQFSPQVATWAMRDMQRG